MPKLATRFITILAVPLLLAGVVAAAAPAGTAAAVRPRAGPAGPAAAFPFEGEFDGVAASSATNAWAVGFWGGGTLTEHWDGKAWKYVQTLALAPSGSDLYSVATTSATNAWAVGYNGNEGVSLPLIARWNGTAWKRVLSPSPGPGVLQGVAATSATNAWAVGTADGSALILHWNGKVWTRVPSPNPGSIADSLYSVTATSATNAWAVGYAEVSGPKFTTLILHWNGKTWARVPSPSPTISPELYGVAASSASNAWAVGISAGTSDGYKTLTLHWNGKIWTLVPSPSPAGSSNYNFLQGVAATSANSAWAVGSTGASTGGGTMILRWNGTAWKQVPSPNPYCATCDSLYGVTATSATSAWAVGTEDLGSANVVILRWNGTAWKNFPSAPA